MGNKFAEELRITIQRIYDKGLTTMSGGNLSIRDRENQGIWSTPKGIDKSSLTQKDMMFEDAQEEIHGKNTATSEYVVHKAVLSVNPDRDAVLHSHPSSILGFSAIRKIPESRLYRDAYALFGDRIILAPYANPGTEQLAAETAKALCPPNNVAVLENHGLFISAGNQSDAFNILETVDRAAQIQFNATKLRLPVTTLTEQDIEKIKNEKFNKLIENDQFEHDKEVLKNSETLVAIMKRLYNRGISTVKSGSCSVRLSDNRILMSPSNTDISDLTPEKIVILQNNKIERNKQVDAMYYLHSEIYKANSDIHAVINASPMYLMTYAVTSAAFNTKVIPECYKIVREVNKSEFAYGIEDYKRIAGEFTDKCPTMIIKNDCFIVTGETILNAYDRIEVAEATSKGLIDTAEIGEAVTIDEKDIERFNRMIYPNENKSTVK